MDGSTLPRRIALSAVRLLLRAFFREIETAGVEHVPLDRGGVYVSWHPNALIDPALIMIRSPRPVVFVARHGLFRWPLLGQLLRSLGTVPIYRAADVESLDTDLRREANSRTLDVLAERVAAGAFTAVFPEGVSHDEPHPVALKTGTARLYYRARTLQVQGAPAPVIVPVGLHYDRKRSFRSRALVSFHPPLELPAPLDRAPDPERAEESGRELARELTRRIEQQLHEVVHATDDWRTHRLLHRGRKLVRAERARRASADPGRPGVAERASGFARIRAGYYELLRRNDPRVAALLEQVERYDHDLRALGLDDHHLDRNPSLVSPWLVALLLLQALCVFLLLPPILTVGYLANAPAALLVLGIARLRAAKHKDVASLKILAGSILFPLTWIGVGLAGYLAHRRLERIFPALPAGPLETAIVLALLAIVGALASVRYARVARATTTALRIRLTRSRALRALARLRRERSRLYDSLMELEEGLDR